jgi:hypothetical protein
MGDSLLQIGTPAEKLYIIYGHCNALLVQSFSLDTYFRLQNVRSRGSPAATLPA